MSMKLKTIDYFNLMKRTYASANIKNAFSVSDIEVKEQCNLLEEKINRNVQNNSDQKGTSILSSENKNIIETGRQSVMNINTNQVLNFPVKKKLNLKNLKKQIISAGSEAHEKNKNKLKGTVNLELMKEELKQLEDPPITQWEKDLMASRLTDSFFDQPCEELAQNLLGKILVRRLENGTILKGRIVETESYLGIIDKASHTYQHRVSLKNLPMYMAPGTIYVYFTYGMYYCFNLSSQEPESRVQIRSIEPLIGLNYMELLLNTKQKEGQQEKEMVENIKHYKAHELCNDPSKICTAFNIEKDIFDNKNISQSSDIWIDKDSQTKILNIITIPDFKKHPNENDSPGKRRRYLIADN